MRKKSFSCLLACGMMLASLGMAAHAAETTEATSETTAEAASETTAEAASETTTEAASETTGELSDDLYSFQVKVDGVVYQFPTTYADFTAQGWVCSDDDTVELAPYQYDLCRFKKGELETTAYVANMGINTVPVSECQISGMSIDSFQFDDAPDTQIELPKGIKYNVSTQEDVVAAYGEASDVYEGDNWNKLTYDYDSYQSIELYLDAETGLLCEFDIENMIVDQEANDAAAAEVTGDPTEAVLAYTAPTELGDDPKSGIVEFAGNLYQLPAPVSVFLENGFTLKPEDSDTIAAGKDFGWFSMLKDGKEFRGTALNLDKNATTIENCFVTEIEVDSYDADFPLNIPGGITNHMNADEMLKLLENLPYEMTSDSDTYTYYSVQEEDNHDWSIDIVVNKETNTVTTIEYEKR